MLDLNKKKLISNELLSTIISAIIVGSFSLISYFGGAKWFLISITISVAFLLVWGVTCMILEGVRGK